MRSGRALRSVRPVHHSPRPPPHPVGGPSDSGDCNSTWFPGSLHPELVPPGLCTSMVPPLPFWRRGGPPTSLPGTRDPLQTQRRTTVGGGIPCGELHNASGGIRWRALGRSRTGGGPGSPLSRRAVDPCPPLCPGPPHGEQRRVRPHRVLLHSRRAAVRSRHPQPPGLPGVRDRGPPHAFPPHRGLSPGAGASVGPGHLPERGADVPAQTSSHPHRHLPANHARLEEIRTTHLRASEDPSIPAGGSSCHRAPGVRGARRRKPPGPRRRS